MKPIKDISIKYKIIMVVMIIFIVTAGIAFIFYSINESNRQKDSLKHDALFLAKYTAEYCSAPLFFGIKEETSQILENLRSTEDIIFVGVYDNNGDLFVSFNPHKQFIPHQIKAFKTIDSVSIVSDHTSLSNFIRESVIAKEDIVYQEIKFGTIVIKLSLRRAEMNFRKNIRSAALITFFMLLLVYLMAFLFQKIISEPILTLANVSEKIKKDANYSIRLKKRNNDEIGLLYDRFNNMLEQIELRDKKRDMTEKMLKKSKEQAENADKLKSAFLANMSHEIRTPMNSIIGFAGLLNDNELPISERTEYLELINSSCNTLLHLIDDILDISKIEAGQLTINFSKFNISVLLYELYMTFNEINNKYNNSKVELILNIPTSTSGLIIESDEIRINQIISNLLSNAIKFTHDGHIEFGYTIIERIRNSERKKLIKFFVNDTGVGIDKQTQQIIFDRFTKIEPDNNKLYQGAGLGLTISKKLVELLDGEISVESKPNKGSYFSFILPVSNDTQIVIDSSIIGANIRKSEPFLDFESKKIMIVEDDPSNFELLKAMLKKTKAKVSWSKNGSEAIENCKKVLPDVILMDIKMPDMDGYETVTSLRKMKIHIPIIAQTAYARFEDENKILNSGFNAYLSKPIEKDRLFLLLNKAFMNEL